nr:MAG TPA: hypothetical protein [Caudoviricetes sp.]
MHFALKGGTLLFVIKRTSIPALVCSLLAAPPYRRQGERQKIIRRKGAIP